MVGACASLALRDLHAETVPALAQNCGQVVAASVAKSRAVGMAAVPARATQHARAIPVGAASIALSRPALGVVVSTALASTASATAAPASLGFTVRSPPARTIAQAMVRALTSSASVCLSGQEAHAANQRAPAVAVRTGAASMACVTAPPDGQARSVRG